MGRRMAEYLGKSEQQKKRAYSPAVITQGGKTVWALVDNADTESAAPTITQPSATRM